MDIPGYTILRELGRGGMATVYLARQDRLGREVALKIMQPLPGVGDDFRSRFIKEGRIIARLQHPQIVTIYDLDSVGDLHYFSMEFLPNGTLADLIPQGLSPAKAVDITRRVAHALSIAHQNGVIHRDIKPQNILFRADGTPVLTDFGIARSAATGAEATALTTFGMVVGSPRYMSPEQSMSRPIDARSDLYSLGVLFYEMLTQELPYQAEDVISLAMQHCSAPVPELPHTLSRHQPIIHRLLAKTPEERFEDTEALIRALDRLEQEPAPPPDDEPNATILATRVLRPRPPPSDTLEPTDADDHPTEVLAARPRRGRTKPILSLGVLIAAVGLGVVILQMQTDQDPLIEITRALPAAPPERSPTIARYESLALEHLGSGEYDQSMELIELARAAQPEDPRLQAIETLIADHAAAAENLAQAQRSFAQQDFAASLTAIEDGLARVPNSPQLLDLQAQVQAAVQDAKRAAAAARREEAEQALADGQLAEAMRLVREGLTALPEDPALTRLEQRIKTALETDRSVREILSDATNLIAEGLLQDSLELIDNGLTLAPADQALADLRATVARQMEREKERQAASLRQQAESELEQGAFDQALNTVERALVLQPQAPELTATREKILGAKAVERTQDLLARAQARLDAEDAEAALELTDSALLIRPDDAQALALRTQIQEAIAKRDAIASAAAEAQRLSGRGRLDQALERLASALDAFPEEDSLSGLRAQLVEQQNRQRRAAAGALAEQAARRFDDGNLDAALVLLEQGRRLDPEGAALTELRARILAEQAAEAARAQALADCADSMPDADLPAGEQLSALAATTQCYASIEPTGDDSAERDEPLGQVIAQLAALLDRDLPPPRLDDALALAGRLLALQPENETLRRLGRDLAERAGLLPAMVEIDGDCFLIGAPDTVALREADESAQRVCVEDFAISATETTVGDFRHFVAAADFKTDAERGAGGVLGCWSFDKGSVTDPWAYHAWAGWREPNKYHKTRDDHPVTCVSQNDARAYLRWLSALSGQSYRLPTEAEWEFAARAATTSPTFWGESASATACLHANVADAGHDWDAGFPCNDGYEWIAPVGTFKPNPWALHDMLGNASEWTCSEYTDSYRGDESRCAPADSRAPMVLRGGAWNTGPAALRASFRNRDYPESRYSFVGFRAVRDRDDRQAAAATIAGAGD